MSCLDFHRASRRILRTVWYEPLFPFQKPKAKHKKSCQGPNIWWQFPDSLTKVASPNIAVIPHSQKSAAPKLEVSQKHKHLVFQSLMMRKLNFIVGSERSPRATVCTLLQIKDTSVAMLRTYTKNAAIFSGIHANTSPSLTCFRISGSMMSNTSLHAPLSE